MRTLSIVLLSVMVPSVDVDAQEPTFTIANVFGSPRIKRDNATSVRQSTHTEFELISCDGFQPDPTCVERARAR